MKTRRLMKIPLKLNARYLSVQRLKKTVTSQRQMKSAILYQKWELQLKTPVRARFGVEMDFNIFENEDEDESDDDFFDGQEDE